MFSKGKSKLVAALMLVVMTIGGARIIASNGDAARVACHELAGTTTAATATVASVTLHFVDRSGMSNDAAEEMMEEAARLWRASHVNVQWSRNITQTFQQRAVALADADAAAASDVVDLYVTVTNNAILHPDQMGPDAPRRPLASILFVGGAPTTQIQAYPQEANRLLEGARIDDRPLNSIPSLIRQRLLGRVLGRAVAHELGHFLFNSSEHAAQGLMRAHHRTDALVSPSARPFRVVAPFRVIAPVAAAGTGSTSSCTAPMQARANR